MICAVEKKLTNICRTTGQPRVLKGANERKIPMNNVSNHMKTPTSPEEYDLLVLGSGAAGKLISWTLAKKGMKTGRH